VPDSPEELEPVKESPLVVAARQQPLSAREEAFLALSERERQDYLAAMRRRVVGVSV
jgi:hypothetical protein